MVEHKRDARVNAREDAAERESVAWVRKAPADVPFGSIFGSCVTATGGTDASQIPETQHKFISPQHGKDSRVSRVVVGSVRAGLGHSGPTALRPCGHRIVIVGVIVNIIVVVIDVAVVVS